MSAWGFRLYDDDAATDLKETIARLAKVPVAGSRLLELLQRTEGSPLLTDDGGPTFWLVVADQFERRGIHSEVAFKQALAAIDEGADHADLKVRGASDKDLDKRATSLSELRTRLLSPRPERKLPKSPKPPDSVVSTGDVYAFPTMAGFPFATHISSREDLDRANFHPDGWGALLVVAQGRIFDWLPWCAVASVSVDPTIKPDLTTVNGQLMFHSQTKGATICVPKKADLKAAPFELIGRLPLNPEAANKVVSKWAPLEDAVAMGWSIRYAAFGRNCRFTLPLGPEVSSLVAA